MNATTASPKVKKAVGGLPDFSERLSPMLVKELRQGMRSPLFVWGMIGMNLGLAGLVPFTMEDPEEEFLHQVFFGMYCFLVCGLLPMRAAGALHEEIRGHTLDTLLLTQLNGWRVVVGKWVAVVAQQLLVTVTILPYGIVRYYAGGVNLAMELAWLLVFLLVGILSAAFLAGISWISYFLLRAAVMMAVIFASGAFCTEVLERIYSRYDPSYLLDGIYREGGWIGLLLLVLPAGHLAFAALDAGACQVGGFMAHRSRRRRLAGIVALLMYGGAGLWFWQDAGKNSFGGFFSNYAFGMAAVTFLALAGQALMEVPLPASALTPDGEGRQWLRRPGRLLLKSGWPGGVFYVSALGMLFIALVLCGVVFLDQLYGGTGASNPQDWWSQLRNSRTATLLLESLGVLAGTLPIPLVIYQVMFRTRLAWNFGAYFLIFILTLCVQTLIYGLAIVLENDNWMKLGCLFPTMSWFLYPSIPSYWTVAWARNPEMFLDWNRPMIYLVTATCSILWWQLAILLALRHRRMESTRDAAET